MKIFFAVKIFFTKKYFRFNCLLGEKFFGLSYSCDEDFDCDKIFVWKFSLLDEPHWEVENVADKDTEQPARNSHS